MNRTTVLFLLFFTYCECTFGSTGQKIDSLLTEIKRSGNQDEVLLDTLIYEMVRAEMITPDELSPSLDYPIMLQIAESFMRTGSESMNKGSYTDALKRFNNAATLFTHLITEVSQQKKKMMLEKLAGALSNCGLASDLQGNYPDALEYHFKALGIREELNDKKGISASYNNIGVVYYYQGNYPEALKYNILSLKYKKKLDDKRGMANCYLNSGNIYWSQNNPDSALINYIIAKDLFSQIDNKYGVAACLNNMGELYRKKGELENALKCHEESIIIKEEINDLDGLAGSYINLGIISFEKNNITESMKGFLKGIMLAKQTGSKSILKDGYEGLATVDSVSGNFKDAYTHFKLHTQYKDSLINESNIVESERAKSQYEFDKRETALKAEQEKKNALAEEEKQRQKVITYSVSAGLVLVALLALIVFRGYRQKKRANIIISDQKSEMEKSKRIIEAKNKDITDSINYARRIQQARLPKIEDIYTALPECFILFKPKDIVSGDFYFFHEDEQELFIAAADCTGHGVPGAFMSMIGSEKLEEAVKQKKDPSEILNYLNRKIKSSLRQSQDEDSTRDGMDIALCAIDRMNRKIRFSGANRPLWIIKKNDNELVEIKATKKALGGFTDDMQLFESHHLQLDRGDTFYIFSDGYADTFGGNAGKKITTRTFKMILTEIQGMSMREQEHHLCNFLEKWKGEAEQIDDILVIGVRL